MKNNRDKSKDRIICYEDKLNLLINITNKLEINLLKFKELNNTLKELNTYYGSKEWFLDRENIERGLISQVKCGVLSEDAVWNLNLKIKELFEEMNIILKIFKDK